MLHNGYKVLFSLVSVFAFFACSDINNSWEDVGGGYVKYQINDGSKHTIGLDPDDVRRPSYFNHYFSLETNEDSSSRGDRIAFLVADPKLGKKNKIAVDYTWFQQEYGARKNVIPDSSSVTFDQRDDSTWTGFFDLYFPKCNPGDVCNDDGVINVSGRFRYWPDPDD